MTEENGHPISQAYLISVGNVSAKHDPTYSFDHGNAFLWLIRMVYYFSFLVFCGLILWKYLFKIQKEEDIALFQWYIKYTNRAYIAILVLLGIIQFFSVYEEFGIKDIPAAFFYTISGQAWCFSVVVLIVGTILLNKRKWFDYLLVILLLSAVGQKIAPISIPMKHLTNNTPDLNRYSYTSVGPFLSFPGTLGIVVTIFDQDDNWTQLKKEMTIYPIN